MTTFHRRRQWRDRQARKPPTYEDLFMSHQAMGFLCALAGLGTVLILLLLILGQPFVDALFGH